MDKSMTPPPPERPHASRYEGVTISGVRLRWLRAHAAIGLPFHGCRCCSCLWIRLWRVVLDHCGYWVLYRLTMKLTHRWHWHYMKPCYPEGDTLLWCQWCGIRIVTHRRSAARIGHGGDSGTSELRNGSDGIVRGHHE
jgi:hypothetical protein